MPAATAAAIAAGSPLVAVAVAAEAAAVACSQESCAKVILRVREVDNTNAQKHPLVILENDLGNIGKHLLLEYTKNKDYLKAV